ncbi:hypothetical protein A3I53_04075 [Candidatus Curtissbacteria bacterium RIFCSPLOWO2_02_FULL_40_13b]|uniref:DUF4870 domain-containing protein n=2 Tax=Candidatus Curtissiibacteriota TaxID=1752717 RepID=A0A1F5HPD6_9BACT|nr:MAG: hypothetical protein A2693_00565 [Candidatus Curtissbacteria bacterium RIFCSPHIGHO2_01_FULL_40_12]OGE05942.1 MAG: hypothetical protein A3I53_04075 [Candidatus Curtissbacteria bacterium RIFCSPLOWO2_02_FULL_40_13b]
MAASDRNIVAALSYVLGFITGIVILLVEKDDKFIRFHAMQSTIATGSLFLLNIAVGLILKPLGILDVLAGMLNILFWFLILLVIIISFVRTYQGKLFKWPIVGAFSEKQIR